MKKYRSTFDLTPEELKANLPAVAKRVEKHNTASNGA
jgi:hypothetical protein